MTFVRTIFRWFQTFNALWTRSFVAFWEGRPHMHTSVHIYICKRISVENIYPLSKNSVDIKFGRALISSVPYESWILPWYIICTLRYNTCSCSSICACAMVHYDFKSPTGARILRPARSSFAHTSSCSFVRGFTTRYLFTQNLLFALYVFAYVCMRVYAGSSRRRCNTFTIAPGECNALDRTMRRTFSLFSPDFGNGTIGWPYMIFPSIIVLQKSTNLTGFHVDSTLSFLCQNIMESFQVAKVVILM